MCYNGHIEKRHLFERIDGQAPHVLDANRIVEYAQAKAKYQEVLQEKKNLERDNQELKQKYAQKSM